MARKNKGYKIESYGRIFDSSSRRRKKRVRNTIIFIILIALLVFLGYSMAGPLKNLLKGQKTELPGSSSVPASSHITSSAIAKPEKKPSLVSDIAEVSVAYMPREVAADETRLSVYLENIKKFGYNTVVIELKDDTGNIYFAAKNEMANTVGAVSPAPLDVTSLVTKIKEAGLIPVAEIHAFKDKTATKNGDAKIKYKGKEGWSWFDAANGKPWLNPYSDAAQGYITALSLELVDLGFENVMVSSIMFPQVFGFKSADFGPKEQTVSHADILAQYTATLKTALNEKGATLLLSYDGAQAQKENNVVYGSANPVLKFSADVFVPAVSLSADNGVELAKFVNDLKALKPQSVILVKYVPVSVDGLAFTKEQIDAQNSVLLESGVYVCELSGNYIG